MNKKRLIIGLFLSLLMMSLLAGCNNAKWQEEYPNMPADLITFHQNKIAEAQAILDEDPENIKALFEIGFRNDQLGNLKEAVKYYEMVQDLSPGHYPSLSNLATIYEKVEEYKTASKYIMDLYERNPDDVEVLRDAVRILAETKEYSLAEEAIANYEKINGPSDFVSELRKSVLDTQNNK